MMIQCEDLRVGDVIRINNDWDRKIRVLAIDRNPRWNPEGRSVDVLTDHGKRWLEKEMTVELIMRRIQ